MNVLLLDNVKGVGQKGDLVKVSDGFARNFLLPRGLATFADAHTQQQLAAEKERERAAGDQRHSRAEMLKRRLGGFQLNLELPANSEGVLYAALNKDKFLAKLKESVPQLPTKAKVADNTNIKHTGVHEVTVEIAPKVTASVKVNIKAADA